MRHLGSHNIFLGLLTETGLPGLALFLVLLSLWVRTAWRTWRDPRAPDHARSAAALLLAALAVYGSVWMFHELSYDPTSQSHRLSASRGHLAADAKRVLRKLSGDDDERRDQCLDLSLDELAGRGHQNGLADCIAELREVLPRHLVDSGHTQA